GAAKPPTRQTSTQTNIDCKNSPSRDELADAVDGAGVDGGAGGGVGEAEGEELIRAQQRVLGIEVGGEQAVEDSLLLGPREVEAVQVAGGDQRRRQRQRGDVGV